MYPSPLRADGSCACHKCSHLEARAQSHGPTSTLQAEKGAQPKHRGSVNKEEETGYWRTVSGFIHKAGVDWKA